MRSFWRPGAALVASLVCCGVHAAALDTLRACAAQGSSQSKGIAALEAECPGLEAALQQLGVAEHLPKSWRDTLTRHGLEDLAALAGRYQDTPAQSGLDPRAMRGILDQLAHERVKPATSWWSSILEWLRSWLGGNQTESNSWWMRWLNRLAVPTSVIKVVTYGLLGLTVIAALAFIVNELRVAGVLARGGKTVLAHSNRPDRNAEPEVLTVADLDQASMLERPAILLRLLVARLLATGQLRAERNLTHRELTTESSFADSQSRERFAGVARLAERVLYGSARASVGQVESVIAEGRTLLQQLEAPQGSGP